MKIRSLGGGVVLGNICVSTSVTEIAKKTKRVCKEQKEMKNNDRFQISLDRMLVDLFCTNQTFTYE